MDYVVNGSPVGQVASKLMAHNWDPGALRPFIDDRGQTCLIINQGGTRRKVITNAPAALRKDAWKHLDLDVFTAARQRLKLVRDLRGAQLVYNLPSGMAHNVLETETASDIEEATISMEPTTEDRADAINYDLKMLPLPVTHKGFHYTSRQIANHQMTGAPLDTTHAVMAGVRVGEGIEKLTLGVAPSYQYGGGNVYGMRNYPGRITASFTLPTTTGWTGKLLISQLLGFKELLKAALNYGPYMLYFGTAWDQYLDEDYSDDKGSNTLRERVMQIPAFEGGETLDFLPGFDILVVQKSTTAVRMVIGFDIITVQWESFGGLKVNFKVIGMMVPQVREDYYGRCGVLHGTGVDDLTP